LFLPPMLLQKREAAFDDSRFIFEPKIDGHRCILALTDGRIRLYTRHNNDVTRQYPELHNVPTDRSDLILDGEIACMDGEPGAIDFEAVMSRFKAKNPAEAAARSPVHFYAFDVLRIGREDVRSRPLIERKALLNEVMKNNAFFSRVISVDGVGKALFDVIKAHAMEGIVAKRKDSVYVGRRSPNWLKVINYTYADVDISGYKRGDFGWLTQIDGKYTGVIELAVPPAYKAAFYNVVQPLVTGQDREYVYVHPRIKARVRFRNWTKRGLLRSPEFVAFITN